MSCDSNRNGYLGYLSPGASIAPRGVNRLLLMRGKAYAQTYDFIYPSRYYLRS